MLKRVGQTEMEKNHVTSEGAIIRIKDASYPAPFHPGLEFNSPVHGNWNIVHTGMLMPETIQIYVCADNCMRGVVLTAAEMNAADRFSYVIIEEDDLLNGNLEDVTIEGVTDVLKKLERKPKAVLLFTVCLHHFLGCDLKMVYEELDRRFPEIAFVRCYMDPIMQKTGLTPDQKLRKAMYDPLKEQKADPHIVTLLGHNFPLDETSDIKRFLKKCGCEFREITTCDTWDKYEKLGGANIFLSIYPTAKYGAQTLAKRLGREHIYMPASFNYEEIKQQMELLAEKVISECVKTEKDIWNRDAWFEKEIAACEESVAQAHSIIGDTPIVIDYLMHPRPLGLAKYLLEHGFCVEAVYLDGVSPEEEQAFYWLREHAPELELRATIQPKMRLLPRNHEGKVLALGQKAAWFTQSPYFVNVVEGAGLYGFDGIRKMAELMIRAYEEEKEVEDLVVRKGWGCESCI
jgi:hypothetical protein